MSYNLGKILAISEHIINLSHKKMKSCLPAISISKSFSGGLWIIHSLSEFEAMTETTTSSVDYLNRHTSINKIKLNIWVDQYNVCYKAININNDYSSSDVHDGYYEAGYKSFKPNWMWLAMQKLLMPTLYAKSIYCKGSVR
jgi:hypothetical protein